MKKVYLFSTIIIVALSTACKNNQKEDVSLPPLQVEAPLETITKECYQTVIEKDTITLTVDVNNVNQFEGNLNYSYFQKDKSFGTLLGNVEGDTIFADYTFQSEGKTAVRELVFLKKDANTYLEGYGETIETNGKMAFKDKRKVKFDGNVVYNKIDCKE